VRIVVVDSLVLLGENRFGPTFSFESALNEADRIGIDGLVAAPARPDSYRLEPANEALAGRAEGEDRISVLGRVDPWNGKAAVEEARRCIDELGCVGLFLHPSEEACPIVQCDHVFEFAAERSLPVVVATGFSSLSEPLQVGTVASKFPEVQIAMTNGGQINMSGLSMIDARLALRENPNLHIMTNGEYRQDFIESLASNLPDRMIWCSMSPWFDQQFELERIRAAQMDKETRRRVEAENALDLFGVPPVGKEAR
jgi:predicted TIM-barrel fold metal-dependent hydrolase